MPAGLAGDKHPWRAPAIRQWAGLVQYRARGGLGERRGSPRPGCQSQASAGPQPTAQPARLPVGDAGPSLTHIPSFGWRFLFFPSPGAPINIPEPADIRAGADPCDAGSSGSTSLPGPRADPGMPEPLRTDEHRDTSKPARLMWSELEMCCQNGFPPGIPNLSHSKPASGSHGPPGPSTQKGCRPQKKGARHHTPSSSQEGSPLPKPPCGLETRLPKRMVTQWPDWCPTGQHWSGTDRDHVK